ncbi:MAG: hypothetical protein AB1847_11320 [bacterium]
MKTLTIQLPDKLYETLKLYSIKKGKNIPEVLRESAQFMIWEDQKEGALREYREERLAIQDLADLLGLSYREVNELLAMENTTATRQSS